MEIEWRCDALGLGNLDQAIIRFFSLFWQIENQGFCPSFKHELPREVEAAGKG